MSETDDDELSKWMMFSRDFGIFKKMNVKFIPHALSSSFTLFISLQLLRLTTQLFFFSLLTSIFTETFAPTPSTTSYFVWINILAAVEMGYFRESFLQVEYYSVFEGGGEEVVKCEMADHQQLSRWACILPRRKLKTFSCCSRRLCHVFHTQLFPGSVGSPSTKKSHET